MKRYIKIIDGIESIKYANKIVIIEDGMQIINPTEDVILADGWIEYVAPPVPEPTEEQKLSRAKKEVQRDIENYDQSSAVNEFSVGGINVWLDKATRAGLLLRFQAEAAQGLVSTSLWYNNMQFPLQVEQAIQMLYAIELYASACYDNTQRHLAAIKELQTIEEVEAYDYKAGYPEKLRF